MFRFIEKYFNQYQTYSAIIFHRWGLHFTLFFAFLIPLKLSLAYFPLFALILSWVGASITKSHQCDRSKRIDPFLCFLMVAFGSSLAGIAPVKSLLAVGSLSFYYLCIPAVREVVARHGWLKIATSAVLGQSLAALHSVADPTLAGLLGRWFLGDVTEAGQLSLTIMVALALITVPGRMSQSPAQISTSEYGQNRFLDFSSFAILTFLFLAYVALAFAGHRDIFSLEVRGAVLTIILLLSLWWVIGSHRWSKDRAGSRSTRIEGLIFVLFPILTAGLISTLKRGPWIGITVALLIFLLFRGRKLLLPTLLVALLVVAAVDPVRDRLLQSWQHFNIAGGRSAIWSVGVELAPRYPLGIGLKNSEILREFSTEIPQELKHFHNNLLNITVETGWLGLSFFILWIFSLLRDSIRGSHPAALLFGLAILAWQVAGIGEYNFGDSEVMLLAFLYIGILRGLTQPGEAATK